MVLHIVVNGKIIRFQELGFISGSMEEDTKENGKIILCMEKGYILGYMEYNIRVITIMIKNKDMENIPGYFLCKKKSDGRQFLG